MNLSKIPEPSEHDLRIIGQLEHEYRVADAYSSGCVEAQRIRVIAHLLRHGSVLAKNIDMVDVSVLPEVRAAISFFEKFGGNDER